MTISIVTICFNSAATIRNTIESVLSQSYDDIEYIIQDGGSTDGTLEILKSFGGRIKWYSEKDQGLYDAMSKGVLKATGAAVGIINSDDIYPDNEVISRVVAAFQDRSVEAVYGDLQYVDFEDTSKVLRNWVSGDYNRNAFLKGWMPPHPTVFVRNEVIEKYGAYNKDFKSAGDYEFLLRVFYKHKIKAKYIPHIQMKMRAGGVSNASLKNRIRANKEDRRAWEINNLTPKWYTLWWKPLSKVKQWISS